MPDHPVDFNFSCGSLGAFSLDDDANGTLPNSKTFSTVMPGTYICTETQGGGYQVEISCSDPDGGTTTATPSATIDVDPGETVTCTFTNTERPGPPAVGGIAGLLDDDAGPAKDAQTSGGAVPFALGGISSLMVLVGIAWILGRRVLH